MALRSVLRLVSTSGPRMRPVHGISPAAAKSGVSQTAAARFMKTGSQGQAKTVAEQESIRVNNQHFIDALNKYFQRQEATWQSIGELSRSVKDLRTIGNVATAVAAAIPWIMLSGRNYRLRGTYSVWP